MSLILLPFDPSDAPPGAARPSGGVAYTNDRGEEHVLWGGSFFEAPLVASGLFRVNLMAERGDLPADLWVPIGDYQPPSSDQVPILTALFEDILARSNDTYAGCFGGVGRTGTILASFLAYLGAEDPILQTRWGLGYRAVETAEQRDFVARFPARLPSPVHTATWLDRPPTAFHPQRAPEADRVAPTPMGLSVADSESADSPPSDAPAPSPGASLGAHGRRPR